VSDIQQKRLVMHSSHIYFGMNMIDLRKVLMSTVLCVSVSTSKSSSSSLFLVSSEHRMVGFSNIVKHSRFGFNTFKFELN